MNLIRQKAIEIAIRGCFCGVDDGEEVEIYEWLEATEDDNAECPYVVWSVLDDLTTTQLYCQINSTVNEIERGYSILLAVFIDDMQALINDLDDLRVENACYQDEHEELERYRAKEGIQHG
jgi:hypothetical protein